MSRTEYSDVDRIVGSLIDIETQVERIANTLDDYMEMSLGMQGLARKLSDDPGAAITAIDELLGSIKERRSRR